MLQPRRLVEGAEYAASLADARRRQLPRFEEHLKALLYVARLLPMDSDPFLGAHQRVRETADSAHGYRVALMFVVDPHDFVTELKWIQIGPTESDLDPWDT